MEKPKNSLQLQRHPLTDLILTGTLRWIKLGGAEVRVSVLSPEWLALA